MVRVLLISRQTSSFCVLLTRLIFLYQQDIRSFFSPKGKTSKPGASKVEDKRGKDSSAKPASKHPGKGRAKSKVRFFCFR